ncbi:alcohol dehydrogenase catalytic domain-containing protein [Rhizobium sp. NPDC090275]|uniref:alcohol dehydrogenase catalytic domain-containing protein n=1 Tax=Rhizobium sp. NPDC090275 TaxID=3364498 RepID=UPI00383BD4CA
MKAIRFHDRNDLRLEDVAAPGPLKPEEILLKPIVCGICGSDLHEYAHGPIGARRTAHPFTGASMPQILGHEFSATVEAIGDGVTNVKVGDRVSIQPQMSPKDHFGRKGWYQLSPEFAVVGFSWPWGGMAQQAVVKDYNVFKVPDGVSDVQAALVEPAAVAVHAVDRAGISPGNSVLITGLGPIGALCAMAARAAGATTIFVSETNEQRLSQIRDLVPEAIPINPRHDDLVEIIRQKTIEGLGVDASIECAGVEASVDGCIDATRPQGRIVQLALIPERVKTDLLKLVFKDIDLRGVIAYPTDIWPRVLELISSGRFPVERIVTSTVTMEQGISAGFDLLLDPSNREMKVLIDLT